MAKGDKITGPAAVSNRQNSSTAGDTKPTDLNFGYGERRPIDENEFKKFMDKIYKMRDFYAPSIKNYNFNEKRAKLINGPTFPEKGNFRGVSFWMFRDQRLDDNWALIYAQKFALEHRCPLYVTFFLMSHYSVAGIRQYDFMLKGLQELEKRCSKLGIQFHLKLGYAKDMIDVYCEENDIDCVVADFMPLRAPMSWIDEAGKKLRRKSIRLYQVDAHNIVPVWEAWDKMAFGATSIRPKIQYHMREFLTEFPNIEKHPYPPRKKSPPADWDKAWAHLNVDESVRPITWAQPGCEAGYRMLFEFITQRLERFVADRNTPTKHAQSCMSPYYHFGNISVQRAILLVSQDCYKEKYPESVESYIEEAVIRRELADNFCYYQPDYDNFNGAFDWAKKSLNRHRKDKREYVYSQEELQFAKTHDKAWNAAQIQMLREGTMHQYMRMYWAKKILEWTPDPEEALRIAILFNDKYQMDGRDPNGYAGCMWSIVGMHDRTFKERPVVGHIRYMTYGGCARKFDVNFYAKTYSTVP